MPRSLSPKDERRIAVEVAWVMDAPRPMSTRDPISVTMLPPTAHSRAATRKMAKPTRYSRLRPTMSESRPMGSSREPMVRA